MVAYHPIYNHPLPERHRFPMIKYDLIYEQLQYHGIIDPACFFAPEPIDEKYIVAVHDHAYWERMRTLTLSSAEIRRIGFPLSDKLVERECRIAEGTLRAAHYALDCGYAFNIAGGTHHAGRDWGEGFCLLNDQAIAAAYLLKEKACGKILMIDLDVHQGNGTAAIFAQDERVFTFSMHAEKNFPFRKQKSDWDIGLDDGTSDEVYLARLDEALNRLFKRVKPEFVFFLSGVDVLATDKLGKLKLSKDACRKRDEMVFQYCKQFKVPVQVSMGGGYSADIRHIINAHCQTFQAAIDVYLV